MPFLNDEQQRLILGEALCGWLGWPVNGSAHS